MSVHKPKMKNIPAEAKDAFVQHHLPYELWMMRECLAAAKRGAATQAGQNMQVECFALHARTVIEFLKNGDTCSFDPRGFTSKEFSVNRLFIRPTLIEQINEQISHLTSDRTKHKSEKFDEAEWQETAEAVEKELIRWLDNLTDEWKEKWGKRDKMQAAPIGPTTIQAHFSGPSSTPIIVATQIVGPTGTSGS